MQLDGSANARASRSPITHVVCALFVTAGIGALGGIAVPCYRDACVEEEAQEVIADFVFFRRNIAHNLGQVGLSTPCNDGPRTASALTVRRECKTSSGNVRTSYECEIFVLDNGTKVVTFRVHTEDHRLLAAVEKIWGTPLSRQAGSDALTFLVLIPDPGAGRFAGESRRTGTDGTVAETPSISFLSHRRGQQSEI